MLVLNTTEDREREGKGVKPTQVSDRQSALTAERLHAFP